MELSILKSLIQNTANNYLNFTEGEIGLKNGVKCIHDKVVIPTLTEENDYLQNYERFTIFIEDVGPNFHQKIYILSNFINLHSLKNQKANAEAIFEFKPEFDTKGKYIYLNAFFDEFTITHYQQFEKDHVTTRSYLIQKLIDSMVTSYDFEINEGQLQNED